MALAASLAQVASGQEALLAGVVQDDAGQSVEGAVVYLHGSARGALSAADGTFHLPAPPADDVLVVSKPGFAGALRHIARSERVSLNLTLSPLENASESVVVHERSGRFAVSVSGSKPPPGPVYLEFPVELGANRGNATVRWNSTDVNAIVEIIHLDSNTRYGGDSGASPLTMPLPSALLRDRPGRYALEVRVLAQGAMGLVVRDLPVDATIAVAYGPWEPKVVQGKPPEVVDPAGDAGRTDLNLRTSADVTGVTFTNETADQFDVVLSLAELRTTHPTLASPAIWSVHWEFAGAEYFVAFKGRREPQDIMVGENFTIGHCANPGGTCQQRHWGYGELRMGTPGAIIFHVPKPWAGAPADGGNLRNPRAVVYETAEDLFFPANATEEEAVQLDKTEAGDPYAFGVRQYAIPPAELERLRAGASVLDATGVAPGGLAGVVPAPGSPVGVGVPWLLLVLLGAFAATGGVAAVLAYRRSRPAPAAAKSETPPSPGVLFLGKYQVERELGRGAFGTTWLAVHKDLHRKVVIKQLHPEWSLVEEARVRFQREARILASLDHPRVTRIYDVEHVGHAWYLVMEFVEGGSLEEFMAGGALPPRDAAQVVLGVLDGLGYIHQRGILHRDLKPSNILLSSALEPKIADFGVARSGDLRTTRLTISGSPPGTPLYMAPEQVRGEPGDARSDLYAVAATFYRAVTGQSYLGDVSQTDELSLRQAIAEKRPKLPLKSLSPALNMWLARGLAKRPEDRFQSAREMADALREALQGT